jgi:hypothetical protein
MPTFQDKKRVACAARRLEQHRPEHVAARKNRNSPVRSGGDQNEQALE